MCQNRSSTVEMPVNLLSDMVMGSFLSLKRFISSILLSLDKELHGMSEHWSSQCLVTEMGGAVSMSAFTPHHPATV